MIRITESNGKKINCVEIDIYATPDITYYVAITPHNNGYLFRSLDSKETESDYYDRLYRGWKDEKESIPLVLLEPSTDVEELKQNAERYSKALNESFEKKEDKKDFKRRWFTRSGW